MDPRGWNGPFGCGHQGSQHESETHQRSIVSNKVDTSSDAVYKQALVQVASVVDINNKNRTGHCSHNVQRTAASVLKGAEALPSWSLREQ